MGAATDHIHNAIIPGYPQHPRRRYETHYDGVCERVGAIFMLGLPQYADTILSKG